MANPLYKDGDRVKAYETDHNAGADLGGFETVILRRMPDAEDYEVELTDEQQQQGISPFMPAGRLRPVSETAEASEN